MPSLSPKKPKKKRQKKPTKFNKGDLVIIKGDICASSWYGYNPKIHKKNMVFVVQSVHRTKGPFLGNIIITYSIYPYKYDDELLMWRSMISDIPESILRKPTKQEKFIYLMDNNLMKNHEDF